MNIEFKKVKMEKMIIEVNTMTGTEVLRTEHREIKIMLKVCNISASRIKNGDLAELDTIAKAVDFFKDFIDGCHHKKEEDILFPLLIKKGTSEQNASVSALLDDHMQGRELTKLINKSLGELQNSAGDTALLASSITAYTDLLEKHIATEDHTLFTITESILNPDEQQHLYEAFELLEEEEIGAGVHEKFHHMIHELAHKYKLKG